MVVSAENMERGSSRVRAIYDFYENDEKEGEYRFASLAKDQNLTMKVRKLSKNKDVG